MITPPSFVVVAGGAVDLGVKNGAILGEDVDLIGGQEVSGVWMR